MFEAVISGLLAFGGALLAVWLGKKAFHSELQSFVNILVTPSEKDKPSPFESYVILAGQKFAESMRNSVAGSMGVDVKLAKGVDKAISMDMLDQSGIGGILDVFGLTNVKSMLARNPATLGLILQRVSPLISQFLGKQGQKSTYEEATKFG